MNATEELRRLLDERGVGHVDAEDGHTQHTWWSDGDHEIAASNSGERLAVYNLTPEQAVDATVGRETCRMTPCAAGNDYARYRCSECEQETMTPRVLVEGVSCGYERPSYCVNCGRKVAE